MPRPPDDGILALRRQLAAAIVRSLGGEQYVIAPSYGISQPRMSELSRGIVERCTVDWLIRRVHRLGGLVRPEIEVGDVRREWTRAMFRQMRQQRAMARASASDPRALESFSVDRASSK